MSPESLAALAGIGGAAITVVGTVYTARAGRRSLRQEKRDDFRVVTGRMEHEIKRLDRRVGEQELESAQQRARIAEQDYTIRWLAGWVRSLVGYIQAAGLEPPSAPRPVPDDVRPFLADLDV